MAPDSPSENLSEIALLVATAQALSLAALDAVAEQHRAHAVHMAQLGAACQGILDGQPARSCGSSAVADSRAHVASLGQLRTELERSNVPQTYLSTVADLLASAREQHRTLVGTVASSE